MRSRWQFLKESQFRKGRGITLVTMVAVVTVAGLYDLGVAQLASEPDKWVRLRDIIQFLPWYIWALLVLGLVVILFFEGGYRLVASRDQVIQGLREEQQIAVVAGPLGPTESGFDTPTFPNGPTLGVIVKPKVTYISLNSRKQKYDDLMEIALQIELVVTTPIVLHKLELVFSQSGYQIEYQGIGGSFEGAPGLPNLPVTLQRTRTYSVMFELTWARLIGSPYVNLRAFTGDRESLSNEFRLKESEQEFDFT